MVVVTEGAKQQLGTMLADANVDDPEVGLRLVLSAAGEFNLALDKEAEGDQVVEHESAKVLLVSKELSGVLEEVTIDSQETPEGKRLVVSKK